MQDILSTLSANLGDEVIGLIGGALFFGSWMLQAYESRQMGRPTVSPRFFAIRAAASALLAVEGIRAESFSVFAVMAATGLLMLYNLYLALKVAQSDGDGK
ncbi:hypothetical protein [Yoonia sp. I 8.24]|uniref:hypothetical protein n=1 Tax=Yoonia sp. I 8.24 TaxID=1537229 RepID=UPI001EDFE823|nr:hypothetical protein [Yoonia sp. I 8.24]MCG3268810.1 hypothetical protein [Yoonia sp. I 8.24]